LRRVESESESSRLRVQCRSFWAEVNTIRHGNTGNSIIVDGCTNESAIAQLFASTYRSLYNSVSFDKDEMQYILNELDGMVRDDKFYCSNCCFTDLDVSIAITKLNSHKNDGSNAGLSTDHLILDRIYHNMFHFCSLVGLLLALYLMNLVFVQFFLFLNLITVILLIVRIFEALLLVLSSVSNKIILS